MPPDTTRPGLAAAVSTQLAAQEQPRQAEEAAYAASLEADAAQYGTPAWHALSPMRRRTIEQRTLNTARTGQAGQE